jgi:hypothetical protein
MPFAPHIFETLFNRKITDEGSYSFLKKITEDYPYFTPAQFFILKLTNENSEAYRPQAAKTSLLFNNPYWMNYLLHESEENTAEQETIEENPEAPKEIKAAEEPIHVLVNEPVPGETVIAPIMVEKEEPILIFEPLHTTDYFASQGIKLSEEIQGNDKLSKQLKSFTEWIKTMKRINPEKIGVAISEKTEIAITQLAEKSNTEEEILTEAMAEVFSQQGKQDKAVEVYQKLSLLNPAKSAYFAAKIEQLNNI